MKNKFIFSIIVLLIAIVSLVYFIVQNQDHNNFEHIKSTHKNHEEHDDHDDVEQVIKLTPEEIHEIGLQTAVAGSGTIDTRINLTGEIKLNEDRMAHIVPRVDGVVIEVNKKLGDIVKTNEVIAVIESRELADVKAEYLAAIERYEIAKLAFDREKNLWSEKISSEEDYLNQKQILTEASIKKRSAQQKLLAIGFDESYVQQLPTEPEQLLTRFEIKAPFEGTIIKKHIVLGELVGTDSAAYIIADLDSVWVDLQIYPSDLKHIKKGQETIISADSEIPDTNGVISYIGPTVETESRSALARVVLSNKSGVFRPGLFVTANVAVLKKQANIVVPKNSIQSLEGKKCVFIKDKHGFEPAFVKTGLEDTNSAEILSGLDKGQEYVTKEAFTLKSKIITSTLDSHAGHGH